MLVVGVWPDIGGQLWLDGIAPKKILQVLPASVSLGAHSF
jgi:hypothetical protein